MTIRATLALASPTNESGPVWSAMTPTLMGSAPAFGDAAMMSSLSERCRRSERQARRVVQTIVLGRAGRYIGRTPHLGPTASPRRVRRHAGAGAGQRVRPAARVAAAVVPARDVDVRGRGVRRRACARPSTGWRCCATSAAPATPTRSPPCSATRSRSAPRRWSTTPANPAEVMRDVIAFATAGRSPEERDEIVRMIQETAHEWAVYNFTSGCEVADMLVQRLDFGPDVREALRFTFERWNGNGYPNHAQGRGDPARRCASCTSATTWRRSAASSRRSTPSRPPATAATARTTRRSPTCSSRTGATGSIGSRETEPWDAVLALEPEPHRMLAGDGARRRPDRRRRLHRPQVAVHGRAQPPLRAARRRRRAGARARRGRRHARSAARRSCTTSAPPCVPNSIWDKPGPLTRTEFDRVELHPMLTEQMLRRSPALAVLNPVASRAPREVRRLRVPQARASRRRRSRRVRAGRDGDLRRADHRASRPSAVLARGRGRRAPPARVRGRARAAREPRGARGRRSRRAASAAGQAAAESGRALPARGRRAAPRGQGLTTRQIADRLFISPKTADHHIQHIYGKIGVSTRAAAALWAMQHAVVQ